MAEIQEDAELAAELGDKAKYYHTGVSDYDSQAKTFDAALKEHGYVQAQCNAQCFLSFTR